MIKSVFTCQTDAYQLEVSSLTLRWILTLQSSAWSFKPGRPQSLSTSSGGLQFSSDFTGGSPVTCQRQFIVSGLPIRMPVPLIQQDAVFFLAANKCSTHKLVLKLSSINSEVGFNKQTAWKNKCVTSVLFFSLFITHLQNFCIFFPAFSHQDSKRHHAAGDIFNRSW